MTQRFGYRVYYTEYERGWGSNIFMVEFYRTYDKAKSVAEEYNKKYNNESTVPDYYIVANEDSRPVELLDIEEYSE